MPLVNKKSLIFLDSSVLIAAALSVSGGSFRLCKESSEGLLRLATNEYVYAEVADVLVRKYPAKVDALNNFFRWAKITVHPKPGAKLVKQVMNIIDPKDAPVLAGAIKAKVDFLVSLDRKDFFTPKLRAAGLPLQIVTPQTFFQEYFNQLV